MTKIKISVITVTYNCEDTINSTISSLLVQNYEHFELIIVDGGSSDNTLNLVFEFEDEFRRRNIGFKVISERDDGIYDAMNKGSKLASGEWLFFLNSGDLLFGDLVFSSIEHSLTHNRDIVYGDTLVVYHESIERMLMPFPLEKITQRMCFIHQSTFIKKELLLANPFDIEQSLVGDWKFFLESYLNNKSFHYCPITVSKFALDGVSALNADLLSKDMMVILKNKKLLTVKLFLYHFSKMSINKLLKIIPLKTLNKMRVLKEMLVDKLLR